MSGSAPLPKALSEGAAFPCDFANKLGMGQSGTSLRGIPGAGIVFMAVAGMGDRWRDGSVGASRRGISLSCESRTARHWTTTLAAVAGAHGMV